jgi:hypothetical protein
LTTWFASPPNPANPHPWRTAFAVRSIVDALAGWTLLSSEAGTTVDYHDQWRLLLQRP